MARQTAEVGHLITDLADEVLHRAAAQNWGERPAPATTAYASAVQPASEAAAALASVSKQLAFMDQTEHLREQPDARDAREAATLVIGDALGMADRALLDAADGLHSASTALSPPSARLQAARRRSTTATPSSVPPPEAAPAAAARPGRIARGR